MSTELDESVPRRCLLQAENEARSSAAAARDTEMQVRRPHSEGQQQQQQQPQVQQHGEQWGGSSDGGSRHGSRHGSAAARRRLGRR
jgi:hypothetical protein